MKESLYALTEELVPLEQALESTGGEITEDNNALVERVTDLLDKVGAKVDAYGSYYRSLESLALAIAEEEKRLKDRRQAVENKMKRLKEAAKTSMEMRDITKIQGKLFTISIQKNGGKVPMELLVSDPDKLPPKFTKMSTSADLEAIRKGLEAKDPDAESVAKFGDVGSSVRIR